MFDEIPPREPGYSDYCKQWGWHGTTSRGQLIHSHVLPLELVDAMGGDRGYIGYETRDQAMAAFIQAAELECDHRLRDVHGDLIIVSYLADVVDTFCDVINGPWEDYSDKAGWRLATPGDAIATPLAISYRERELSALANFF